MQPLPALPNEQSWVLSSGHPGFESDLVGRLAGLPSPLRPALSVSGRERGQFGELFNRRRLSPPTDSRARFPVPSNLQGPRLNERATPSRRDATADNQLRLPRLPALLTLGRCYKTKHANQPGSWADANQVSFSVFLLVFLFERRAGYVAVIGPRASKHVGARVTGTRRGNPFIEQGDDAGRGRVNEPLR